MTASENPVTKDANLNSGATRGGGGQRGQLTPPKYLEGPALAFLGARSAFPGARSGFGGAALALEGPALALEGPALALEGPALALQGPALALVGPALALEGPLWPWRARSGFEGVRSCFVGAALAF